MRSGSACAALAVLLALLTGCGPKKPKDAVSPAAQVPDLPPWRMAASLPVVPPPFPPVTTHPVKLDTTTPPEVKTEVATTEPHKPTKRHLKPVQEETAKVAPPPPTEAQTIAAAATPPAEATPLGQLTANDTVTTTDRHAITDRIDATENGVNAIKRPLNGDEQKTVTLIRTHITRARDALKVDDIDGANNLSTKAQQLLQELMKP